MGNTETVFGKWIGISQSWIEIKNPLFECGEISHSQIHHTLKTTVINGDISCRKSESDIRNTLVSLTDFAE